MWKNRGKGKKKVELSDEEKLAAMWKNRGKGKKVELSYEEKLAAMWKNRGKGKKKVELSYEENYAKACEVMSKCSLHPDTDEDYYIPPGAIARRDVGKGESGAPDAKKRGKGKKKVELSTEEKIAEACKIMAKYFLLPEPTDEDDYIPPVSLASPDIYTYMEPGEPGAPDKDPNMCDYCWKVADHTLENCPSRYEDPLPCPGPNAIPHRRPIEKTKENAIRNSLVFNDFSLNPNIQFWVEIFSRYGHVTMVGIPTEEITGRLESFGLVSFRDINDAEAALISLTRQGFNIEWHVDEVKFVMRLMRSGYPLVIYHDSP